MSENESEPDNNAGGPGISDDQLPEDLVPSEDNPLAEGLDPDEVPDDVDLLEGKDAEVSESDDATEDTAG